MLHVCGNTLTPICIHSSSLKAETEAKHESIFGSSPESDGATEDAYYARQENGTAEWSSDDGIDYAHSPQEPVPPSPNEKTMSPREYCYAMRRQWHRNNNLPYSPLPGDDSD